MRQLIIKGGLLVFTLSITASCISNPDTNKPNLVLVSKKKEQFLGDELHEKILLENQPYADDELQLYVNLVGKQVAAKAARQDIDYRFTVLDSEDINAFSGPSGHIYITKNMLTHLNKESHLAAVLAHEIGHVSARHSARKLSKNKLHGAMSGTLKYFGNLIPTFAMWGGDFLADKLELNRIAYIVGYGRELELEADTLGAKYLARSGYQPEDMIGALSILKDQELYLAGQIQQELEPNLVISYHGSNTSTHPRSDERLKLAIEAAENFLTTQDPLADRRDYLTMIDGLDVQSEQVDSMDPEGASLNLFDNGLKGYFPNRFIAYKEETLPVEEQRLMLPSTETSPQLIMLDSAQEERKTYDGFGKYSGSESLDAKSILLLKVLPRLNSESPREFLDQYLRREGVEFERVSGGKVKTPYGVAYFLNSVTVREYKQLGFIGKPKKAKVQAMQGVVFIDDQAIVIETFVNNVFGIKRIPHQRVFKSVMRNIRPDDAVNTLHDQVLKKNYGIALKIVEPGETLASIAAQLLVPDAETKLRLINGYYPTGEPDFGQTIKTFAPK